MPWSQYEGLEKIGLEIVWKVFRAGGTVFVDARSEEEYNAGHIPGALFLPQEILEESLSSLMDLIPLDTLVVTYCSGEGCGSSSEAAELLQEAGFTNVKVFYGGWDVWMGAGHPVKSRSVLESGA